MTPHTIFAEPKLAEIYDLLYTGKSRVAVERTGVSRLTRRLLWQNEKRGKRS